LTVDYAYGHSLEDDVKRVLAANGGSVVGSVYHPFPTADFSSYLLQAQASGAEVVALANAGQDTINSIRQAKEFGISDMGQTLVGLLVFISDAHALGAEIAQGLLLTTGFYWDLDERTRAFGVRLHERTGMMPTMNHAGIYSSITHYLRAVEATGTDEAKAVMAKMREMPVDFFGKEGRLRADGRMVHEMYLARVKSPAQSTGEWDLYEILRTIPGEQAFRPAAESLCPLLKP
jgi:branched-chain amino acid transport system substrate-binding protein